MVTQFSEQEMLEELKKSFNMIPNAVQLLDKFTNYNYKVTCKWDGSSIQYVVKVCLEEIDNYELETQMTDHLNDHGISTVRFIKTINGESCSYCELGKLKCAMQVHSYIPGSVMQGVSLNKSEIKDVYFQVGRNLAEIHQALKSFKYTGKEISSDSYPWVFGNHRAIEEKVQYLEEGFAKNCVVKYLKFFQMNVKPRMGELRKGYVHGDYSDTNIVLTSNGTATSSGWKISGTIDFGDCHFGYLVSDVGNAIAYGMIKSVASQSNPIEDSFHLIRGYESSFTLTKVEKDVLVYAVLSRLTTSWTMGNYFAGEDPLNRENYFIHAKHIPAVFQEIEAVGTDKFESTLFPNK